MPIAQDMFGQFALQQQMLLNGGMGMGMGFGGGLGGNSLIGNSLIRNNFNLDTKANSNQADTTKRPTQNYQINREGGVVPILGALGAGLPAQDGTPLNGLAGGGKDWSCAGITKTDYGWKCTEYGRPK